MFLNILKTCLKTKQIKNNIKQFVIIKVITFETEVKFSKVVFFYLISSMASNGTKARPYRKASVS